MDDAAAKLGVGDESICDSLRRKPEMKTSHLHRETDTPLFGRSGEPDESPRRPKAGAGVRNLSDLVR